MNQNKKFLGLLRPYDGSATNLRNACAYQSTRRNTPQDSMACRVRLRLVARTTAWCAQWLWPTGQAMTLSGISATIVRVEME